MSTDSIPQKQCERCKGVFPETEQYYRKNKSGFRSVCRQCNRDDAAKSYYNNRDTILEHKRLDRIENPEIYRERDRRRIIENHERELLRYRDYHRRNKDKRNRDAREWRKANPLRVKAFNTEYYLSHRESEIIRSRDYYQSHRGVYILHARRNNVKRRTLMTGDYSSQDLENILIEQDFQCAYCGIRLFPTIPNDVHFDHVHPLSRGGADALENLVATCRDCNLSKHDKTVEEWMSWRGW